MHELRIVEGRLRRAFRKASGRIRYRVFAAALRRLGRGFRVPKAEWEEQYSGGNWEKLDSDAERERYVLIAELIAKWCPGGSVLDVGCGTGTLYPHVYKRGCKNYRGMDLCEAAIQRAAERFPQATFTALDAETFSPSGVFDAIVFNEVLCYFRRPLETAHNFDGSLSNDGIVIVSLCDYRGGFPAIWESIGKDYVLLDGGDCANELGQKWTVRVYRPARGRYDAQAIHAV